MPKADAPLAQKVAVHLSLFIYFSNGMKILFAGGGTLGSVSPLIAIWQYLKIQVPELKPLFVGTKHGPEKDLVQSYQIPFQPLATAKFRRYYCLDNLLDLFKLIYILLRSFLILLKFQPDIIVSAGGFTSVPIIWSSILFRKTKVIIYQSDFKAGLANRLVKKFANIIFVAFPETIHEFPVHKTILAGSIVRAECREIRPTTINNQLPHILILGGGTGSKHINELVIKSLPHLKNNFRITHVLGKGKGTRINEENYSAYELLTQNYYQKIVEADLIISRAGLSTLMELSYFSKPTLLIPLPDTAQELNAHYFCQRRAAICLNQTGLTVDKLMEKIHQVLDHQKLIQDLKENISQIFLRNGGEKIAKAIIELCR